MHSDLLFYENGECPLRIKIMNNLVVLGIDASSLRGAKSHEAAREEVDGQEGESPEHQIGRAAVYQPLRTVRKRDSSFIDLALLKHARVD